MNELRQANTRDAGAADEDKSRRRRKEGESEEREEKGNTHNPDTLEQLLEKWMDGNNHNTQENHEPTETNHKDSTPNKYTERGKNKLIKRLQKKQKVDREKKIKRQILKK